MANISEKDLNTKLKKMIREDPFFNRMFREYGIPINKINDELVFRIKKMDDRFSQANNQYIDLDEKLFKDGDFFTEKMHYVVHELTHWLTRQKEQDMYFYDPEEQDAFALGMAFEILRGSNENDIRDVFYPIIRTHFHSEDNAEKLFKALFAKAVFKAKNYGR